MKFKSICLMSLLGLAMGCGTTNSSGSSGVETQQTQPKTVDSSSGKTDQKAAVEEAEAKAESPVVVDVIANIVPGTPFPENVKQEIQALEAKDHRLVLDTNENKYIILTPEEATRLDNKLHLVKSETESFFCPEESALNPAAECLYKIVEGSAYHQEVTNQFNV